MIGKIIIRGSGSGCIGASADLGRPGSFFLE